MRAGVALERELRLPRLVKHLPVSRKKVSGFYTKFIFLTITFCRQFADEEAALNG
jgi:hypothetical protein